MVSDLKTKGKFKLFPATAYSISPFDHGVLYGDGIFEGIRIYNGRIFKLKEHLNRLWKSSAYIGMKVPFSKEQLSKAVASLARKNKILNGYCRLVVTRGIGDLGINPKKCSIPTTFIVVDQIALYPKEFYEQGLPVSISSIPKIPRECLNPNAKICHYENNILSMAEALKKGAREAIMLDLNGNVTECTGDNIFLVFGNTLYTPTTRNILAGITRETVIGMTRKMGLKVKERDIKPAELFRADEVFLTGTGAEIVPVNKIDGRKIGRGNAGPITLKILRRFRAETLNPKNSYPIQ
ncbi:MAG: branched-chain-amino-acid transaminase [Candidatus Aenigmarchaeota archaeon]|nr:branched-chain-amino-acid transaminase [Candidatus Aenigmarchaeota archaeon]